MKSCFKYRTDKKHRLTFGLLYIQSNILLLTAAISGVNSLLEESIVRSLIISKVDSVTHYEFETPQNELILEQELKSTSISYNFNNIPIFVQNSTQDRNKSIVILDQTEDRLPLFDDKTVYVVLRRVRKSSGRSLYWAMFAYLRKSSDTGETIVELDTWEDRGIQAYTNQESLFGLTTCSSSTFFTCMKFKQYTEQEIEQSITYWPQPIEFRQLPSAKNASALLLPSLSYFENNQIPHFQLLQFFADIPSIDPFGEKQKKISLAIEAAVISRLLKDQLISEEQDDDDFKTNTMSFKNNQEEKFEKMVNCFITKHLLQFKLRELGKLLVRDSQTTTTKTTLANEDKRESPETLEKIAKSAFRNLIDFPPSSSPSTKNHGHRSKRDEMQDEEEDAELLESERSKRLFNFGKSGSGNGGFSLGRSGSGNSPLSLNSLGIGAKGGVSGGGNKGGTSGGGGKQSGNNKSPPPPVLLAEPSSFANCKLDLPTDLKFSFTAIPRTGTVKTKTPDFQYSGNPPSSLPSPPPIAYIFSANPNPVAPDGFVTYVTPTGFMFYGCFFPGWIDQFDRNCKDGGIINLGDEFFYMRAVDRKFTHPGAYHPPMPNTYVITRNGKPVAAYAVGQHMFLVGDTLLRGDEIPDDPTKIELEGKVFDAVVLAVGDIFTKPGELGAFRLELSDGNSYLAHLAGDGVLIGGLYIVANVSFEGVTINGKLYRGSFLPYSKVRFQSDYSVGTFHAQHKAILKLFGDYEGAVPFVDMYVTGTALRKPEEVVVRGKVQLPTCPPGKRLSFAGGISPETYIKLMETDWDNEMLKEMSKMKSRQAGSKTGSKGVDNAAKIVTNSIDWGGRKSAGDTFSENLVAGIWTPAGLSDDGMDLIGGVTGVGKISDDNTLLDDVLHGAIGVIFKRRRRRRGIIGKLIDGVEMVLKPVGLDGVLKTTVGIAGGAIGIAAGIASVKEYTIYNLIKTGAKVIGIDFLLGMRGSASAKATLQLEHKKLTVTLMVEFYIKHPPRCRDPKEPDSEEFKPPPTQKPKPHGLLGLILPLPFLGRRRRSTEDEGLEFFQSDGVRGMDREVDLFTQLGWPQKTLRKKNPDSLPFVGVGGCSKTESDDEKMSMKTFFEKLENPTELSDFYLDVLGSKCEGHVSLGLQRFIDFEWTSNGSFQMLPPKGSFTKLTKFQMDGMYKDIEFSAFSITFNELRNQPHPDSYYNFLKHFAFNFLSLVDEHFPSHSVKLTRNLLKTLQSFFTKSLQEFHKIMYSDEFQFSYEEDYYHEALMEALEESRSLMSLVVFISSDESTLSAMSPDLRHKRYSEWLVTHEKSMADISAPFFNNMLRN